MEPLTRSDPPPISRLRLRLLRRRQRRGTSRASIEDALKLETDCVQYRVSVDPKGVET